MNPENNYILSQVSSRIFRLFKYIIGIILFIRFVASIVYSINPLYVPIIDGACIRLIGFMPQIC